VLLTQVGVPFATLVEQTVPQPPQLVALVVRSAHIPLQQVSPLGQAPTTLPQVQCPSTHVSPAGHCTPHAPQLYGSVAVYTQTPLQSVCPAWGQKLQVPFTQYRLGLAQTVPQWPQLFGSLAVLTHVFPQRVWPAGQTQMPLAQIWPPVQVRLHFPQLVGSVRTSVQPALQ
jgi:hypothetical protein